MESLRKVAPGPDANLPGFIVDRMVCLKMRPTLTHLAIGSGTPLNTLRQNLNGSKAMRLGTAVRLAAFLKCDLTELVEQANLS